MTVVLFTIGVVLFVLLVVLVVALYHGDGDPGACVNCGGTGLQWDHNLNTALPCVSCGGTGRE